MINKIKIKLAYRYTSIILFMLSILFVSNFFLIKHIITKSSKSSVEKYLNEECDEAVSFFQIYKNNSSLEPRIHINKENEDAFYNFAYWFDTDGKIIMADELSEELSETKKSIMKNWPYENKKIIPLDIIDKNGDTWNILIAGDDVYEHGEYLGKVFVGKNLTALQEIQKQYFAFVSILIIIMIILSFIFANRMASKAMIPIIEAFDRQNKFVADASHEMRTPLSVMLSSIDLFKTTSKENLEIKNNIKSEILNMKDLVNELLDLARYDMNNGQLRYSNFNFGNSIKETIKNISIIAKNKNIEIIFNDSSKNIISADEKKIKQVIYILIDNAIKYSPEKSTINISLEEDKNNIIFKIKDEGIGIHLSDQPYIFDRFYRVNKARSRSIGGSGLGLAIAAEIMTLHNSKIEVKSDGKNGSEFSFSLKK